MSEDLRISAFSRKIAIWGNMNNMGFALLRYLRDLGADAHLFQFSNDGQGALSHFRPEADTWAIDYWSAFLHRLPFPDSQVAALDAPLSWALAAKSRFGRLWSKHTPTLSPVSRKSLFNLVSNEDIIIGTGIAPAVLDRIDRRIDLFFPYANQIEYIESYDFVRTMATGNLMSRLANAEVRRRQMNGVRRAGSIISFEQELAAAVLRPIGRQSLNLSCPMVYVEKYMPVAPPSDYCARAFRAIQESDISILHHARLLWRRPEQIAAESWRVEGKNNDWLFRAVANLKAQRQGVRVVVLVFEYGPDVGETRKLVDQLGISDSVIWLPLMARKEIMWLLDKIDVGIGEFYDYRGMIWGGTGWEVMASGRPLIQGFHFEEGEFAKTFGYEEPPFFKVRKQDDVLRHLCAVLDDRTKSERIGADCRDWFNTYNGVALAERWLSILAQT